MPAIPLRQRSATEIVDAAFQIFRREPAQFIVATALIYVPWLLIQLAIGDRSAASVASFSATKAMVSFIVGIGAIIVSALVGGVCTALASDYYLGAPTDLPRAYRRVLPRVGSLAVAQILWSLLFGIGLICLIVPGLYVIARFFAVPQVIVLEGGDVGAAFSRSTTLSTDNKPHVLGTLLLAGVIMFAISLGMGMVGALLPFVLRMVLTTIVSAVLYPFIGITQTLLYYDTRIRREGFDVEYLASGAWTGAPSAASPTGI